MILRVAAFLLLGVPVAASACRLPPHLFGEFRTSSYVSLSGCEGQWPRGCSATGISSAWFEEPTARYDHGVLGDAIEAGRLAVYSDDDAVDSCGSKQVHLETSHVFEDTKPRLVDVNGDGRVEVVVVRSHVQQGAQLVIYADVAGEPELQLIAQTPYIGRKHRWLAPVGAADLDGDGAIEVAYIDRPHLAKTLRIWRFTSAGLVEVAAASGLTNHRIGEADIGGGLRICDGLVEMIAADASWQRVIAARFDGSGIVARDMGPYDGRGSFAAAMDCAN